MPNRSRLIAASEPRPSRPLIDTNTTAGILKAISAQSAIKKLPMSAIISSPVPAQSEGEIYLEFFLYFKSGPFNNKKVLPPFSRVQVALGQAEDMLEFVSIKPQDLNLNVEPKTELGCIRKAFSSTSEEEINKKVDEYLQKENEFFKSIDHLIKIYLKPIEMLLEEEKLSVKTYRDYFYAKEEVEFLLPAYQALNPHFFEWIDSAISKN
jgi:hypothetical protein